MFRVATFFIGLFTSLAVAADRPANVPENYKLLYSQDFTKASSTEDFQFADPAAWRRKAEPQVTYLEQFQAAKYSPPFRSPVNIALLKGQKFKDFVLDVECQQTSKEYGHRDMVFVFGFQGPAKFYYVHIATKADDHANQIFIVNDAARTKISKVSNTGNDWGKDEWKKVRIARNSSSGSIQVFFGDLTKPIMTAEDKNFSIGWIGFGTFDDTCRVRNVKIWGPASENALAPEFPRKK